MANTLKFGNGEWYGKKDTILAYNDENSNYKPLPFDFSRASKATVINKDGLIEEVGSGEPRIDYKNNTKGALLLEPSRSNALPYSNKFLNTGWQYYRGTITANATISPDGTLNASRYQEDSQTGSHLFRRQSLSITNGLSYTGSIFAKKGELTSLRLASNSNSRWVAGAEFNLENGTVTSGTGVIENYGNGWYRCSISGNAVQTTTVAGFEIYTSVGVGRDGDGLFMYGAMFEQGSYATSYIPTSGSAVTRLADVCLKEDINTSIINSSYPFSMYAESTYIGGNKNVLSFSKKVVSNNYYQITINTNEVMLDARANGSTELIQSGVTLLDGQKFKVAVTMESATSGKICVNGSTVVSKTNFSNQAVNNEINDLLLGQLRVPYDTGERLPVTDVKLYNTALTDQELIALTQV